jgi:hypothetical protein
MPRISIALLPPVRVSSVHALALDETVFAHANDLQVNNDGFIDKRVLVTAPVAACADGCACHARLLVHVVAGNAPHAHPTASLLNTLLNTLLATIMPT